MLPGTGNHTSTTQHQAHPPAGIVLLSGGMDSCVTAAIAARDHDLSLLHLQYGQRTAARELRAFNEIADHYGVSRRLVVPIHHLSVIGGSSLTDRSIPVPEADLGSRGIPSTYVPFRNANLLGIAVSWAEVIGATSVFIGAVEEDSSGYPDCRETFFSAYQEAVKEGTRPGSGVRIVTPVIRMSKREIVLEGMRLGAPLHLTWSCYQGEEEACGRCDSCALRLRAFKEAGIEDPIPYAVGGSTPFSVL